MGRERKKNISKLFPFNGMNEKGFTLIETMLALAVTILAVSFISLTIRQNETIQQEMSFDKQLEWHIFLNQLEHDLEGSTFIDYTAASFTLTKKNQKTGRTETIDYEQYKYLCRRLVDGRGHQPVLMDISAMKVKKEGNGLWLEATFLNGETYKGWVEIYEIKEPAVDE